MMFRIRDFICLGVVLLLIFGTLLQFKGSNWFATNNELAHSLNHSEAKRRIATRINDEWTTFHLPGDALAVRVFSNAIVEKTSENEAPTLSDPRRGFRYAIEYEFLDGQMNSLDRGVYHFRSGVKELVDPESGGIVDPIKFADFDANVAQTRVMQISLEAGMRRARIVRLKTTEMEEGVLEILARTLYKTKRKNLDRYGAWDSVSDHRKEIVARNSVYEHRLLDHNSRIGLLKWEWNRTSSVGEPLRRYLYFDGDSDDLEIVEAPFPQGVVVQPGWKVVAPVCSGLAKIRVEATPLDKGASIHGQLHYRFKDPDSGLENCGSRKFAPSGNHESHLVEINDVSGVVEFETECPAALRFWCRKPSADGSLEWTEIEVEPKHSTVYIADDRPVAFSVSHVNDEVTPLKASFRFAEDRMFDAESSNRDLTRSRRIHWRFVGDAGQTIQEGVEELNPEISSHERFWRERVTFSVTDAIKLWFPVPPNVASVEFWCKDSPVLINAHTRPAGLPAQTRVPEDYNVVQRKNSPYRRWFTVRPRDHQEFIAENRVLNLGIQNRLPEFAEESREKLVWNRFLPEGDWLGSRILVPAKDPLESQDSQKPDSVWLWHEMTSRAEFDFETLDRTSHYGNVEVSFMSELPAGPISVWCNDELIASKEFSSSRGEFRITLPQVRGTLRFEFQNGVRVFASGIEMDSSNGYLRRTAMRVGSSPTRFEYEKKSNEDELLTLTLYRDESESTRASLKARIVPHDSTATSHQPRDTWTIRDRSYDLSLLPVASSLLVDRTGRLDSGSRCFIKLGHDMPPGKYTIEVQREDAMAGYLLLYQTVPEPKSVRRIGIFDKQDIE